MTGDMTESIDAVYRVTVFLNNGTRVMFSTRDESSARFVKGRFSFEHMKNNTPVEIVAFAEQKLIFVPANVSMVIQEQVLPGMEYTDDPLDRFVYH